MPPPPSPLSHDEWELVVASLRLTPREADVVDLLLRGLCDKQIAASAGLKVSTVRSHFRQIFTRLDLGDRVRLVLRVFEVVRGKPPQN